MKNKQKSILAVMVGLAILGLIGCEKSSSFPTISKNMATKLASDTALKKGWAELPIPIFISSTVPEKFRTACLHAMDMWSEEAGIQLFDYQGITDSTIVGDDGINGMYWDTKPNSKGYFAETKKSWLGESMIVEADVMFYGSPDDFAELKCDGGKDVCVSPIKKKDIATTALHELGHVLGFVHTDTPDRLMNPDFTYGDVYLRFDDEVATELKAVYNPTVMAGGDAS
ncbi:MAG: matrixin family metalloprotease [Pseudomonadota bacterium]